MRGLYKHLLFFGLAFSLPAFAQETPSVEKIDDFDLEQLMNVEVSAASKQKQKPHEAPATVSVMTRDHFYEYGFFTLNDAMEHQAGFFPSQDYDRRVIGSRGLFEGWNNNHVLHLVDGVPFNDPMYGSAYTWENTPIFMIKSVEVIRGPGSALYGTNATNGVIAVQTLSGSDMKGKAEGRIRVGSQDSRWLEAYTGNVAGNFNYFTGFSSYRTDGNTYDSYDDPGLAGTLTQSRIRDDRTAQYMLLKVEGANELKGLSLQFHDQQWTFQTGHGWLFAIPDYQDAMKEHRQVATASYVTSEDAKLRAEFTLKYEHKEVDWFTRYAPDGHQNAYGTYPTGISEYANFTHENYFFRGQTTYDLGNKANVLAGVETNTFVYNGDKSHYSNTDLSNTYGPNAGGAWSGAPAILGLIKGKPMTNIGLYTQFMTGEMMTKMVQLTAGLRYDIQEVNYDGSLVGEAGTGSRTFKQFSPRLAAVIQPTDELAIKAMFGRAFRAPAPSELAGTGTWALANNIRVLEPETVTTFEVGADWRPSDRWNFKATFFHTKSADQIGYNQSQANLSTNIYTATTAGSELEASLTSGRTKSFANFSYSQRLGEDIQDTSVTGANESVTWAPSMTGNIGVTQTLSPKLKATLLGQYISAVKRRDSDNATAANLGLRGGDVPEYYGFDVSLIYQIVKGSEFSLYVKNVTDKDGYLVKNRDYAFDYQMDGRTYYGAFSQSF